MVLLTLLIGAVMISNTKAQTATPPTIPSCEHLQQIDGSVQCNAAAAAASSPFERTFGFGGGGLSNFAGGFSGRFIYDVYCNQWRSVHYRDCPVAYQFDSYNNFCNNPQLTAHLYREDVAPVYVLDLLGGGGLKTCQFTPLCLGCPVLSNSQHSCSRHSGSHGSHFGGSHGSHFGSSHGSHFGSSHDSQFRGFQGPQVGQGSGGSQFGIPNFFGGSNGVNSLLNLQVLRDSSGFNDRSRRSVGNGEIEEGDEVGNSEDLSIVEEIDEIWV